MDIFLKLLITVAVFYHLIKVNVNITCILKVFIYKIKARKYTNIKQMFSNNNNSFFPVHTEE